MVYSASKNDACGTTDDLLLVLRANSTTILIIYRIANPNTAQGTAPDPFTHGYSLQIASLVII